MNPFHDPAANEGAAQAAALLMKHRTDLAAYLMSALRNPHDVEDLLQEVSLAAIRSYGEFVPGADFLAWVRGIARHRILALLKKNSRMARVVSPELLDRMDRAAREAAEENPADARRAALRDCVQELRGTARRVIEARYDEGWDVERIARVLGRTLQSTYAILKRARQALRDCMERRLTRAQA